jgi:CRP-like cAMP-binding protein
MKLEVADKIQEFFQKYPKREYSKGQILIQAGEEPTGIFYLEAGRVNQYDISAAGTEAVVNVFQPPAFFPMSWAINRTPNLYFFEAAADVVARQVPAADVVAFVQREPDVLFDLLSRVYKGSDGLLRRLAHLMAGDARTRLLFEIILAAYRFGKTDGDGSIHLPFREGELAKHSGLARETVNRMIQGFKANGLVEVGNGGLRIPDITKLEAELGADL